MSRTHTHADHTHAHQLRAYGSEERGEPEDDRHRHDHEHGGGLSSQLAHFLSPHSHDANDRVDDAVRSSAAGIRAVKVSLVGLVATGVLQLLLVLFTGSVALLADTIHNSADASTAVPLWIAFSLGRRLPTKHYSYGYGRAEDLAGVFIVLMITASALAAGWESIQRLIRPSPIGHLEWIAAAGIIGFLGNEFVAQYRIRWGKRIGSAALVADGLHARTDGFTSLGVVASAVGIWLGFPQADPLIGLVITVAMLAILKDAIVAVWRRLMDAVEEEVAEAVGQACAFAEGVRSVESIRARWVGHNLHADVRITAEPALTLAEAHAVAERARHAMLHAVPKLTDVVVHVDPEGDHDELHALAAHHRPARHATTVGP